MMKRCREILVMILIVGAFSASADPVSGVVFGVSDDEIEILVSSGKMPMEGMVVEVFESSEAEKEISIGTWIVTRMDINIVYARPELVSGTPQLGQTARIGKSKPKPKPKEVQVVASAVEESTVPVAVSPVEPPKQEEVAVTPQEKARENPSVFSAADQKLLDDLASGDAVRVRYAAKYLYRGRYESSNVMDKAAEVLEGAYNDAVSDAVHVDAMAWICKALWASGKAEYLSTLRTVEQEAKSIKLRKYALKYRVALEKKIQ
ncbi:hypothetical protein P4B35_10740 [Pontiellaceae bacterium B12227]|nr:hypothetical protein [Pontiellaceae bacterium B12227]